MTHINENLSTKITDKYDVIVAGSGIAGISAALAAARQGAKTLLIENSYILGGLATSGLVTIYLPLCDGLGKQISFGICEELIRLSIKHGAEARYNKAWFENGSDEEKKKSRFQVQFNPNFFAMEAEKLLLESKVTILYGTKLCNAVKSNGKITHIIVENKSGRQAFSCGAAIDCTGDADLFEYAKLSTKQFEAQNILAGWYYYFSKGSVGLRMLGFAENPDDDNDAAAPLTIRRFTGLDAMDNSEMVQMSHSEMLSDILSRRAENNTYIPVTMPTIPQLRMTRRIVGKYTVSAEEKHKYCETSIGMISNWKKCGPVYEIPFESLFSSDCTNLFAAGRCISVTEEMWDISRVIPSCAVTGEAAGIAASLAASKCFDIKTLQKKLTENGVVLHEKDL